MAAKFEVYEQSNGGFGFRLKAANGQIIAQGQNYKTKEAAMAGIEAVKAASGYRAHRARAQHAPRLRRRVYGGLSSPRRVTARHRSRTRTLAPGRRMLPT